MISLAAGLVCGLVLGGLGGWWFGYAQAWDDAEKLQRMQRRKPRL